MPARQRDNRVATAVAFEDVLRAWYDRIPEDSWAFAHSLYVGDSDDGFLVAEDDAGFLWRIPYTVSGDNIDFGEPVRSRQRFEDVPDDGEGDRESVTVQAGMKVVHCARPHGDARPADQYLQAAALRAHSTDTSDASWDASANEARLSNDDGADVYRQAYAWVDDDADADTKGAYRFLHHEVSESGTVGAANTAACSTGIGVLNGGRGVDVMVQPWADDRDGIHAHLSRHITDAGGEPPELQDLSASVQASQVTPRRARQAAPQTEEDDVKIEDLRELLGLPDTADEEAVKAAIRQAREQQEGEPQPAEEAGKTAEPSETEPAEGTESTGEPAAEQVAASRQTVLAELNAQGLAVIDADRLSRLEKSVTDYEAERKERAKQERDRVLAAAVKQGKFAPARIGHWRDAWDADPEGTRHTVETVLAAGLIPVEETGHSESPEMEVTDADVRAVSDMVRARVGGKAGRNGKES